MSITLAEGVSVAETDSGAVLLDERSGRYWQLNAAGARVLNRLLSGDTPARAGIVAANGASVPAERTEADAHALLEKLRQAGLVRR
ncbi:lasso peptide biosynthesis PqqD family chaperone [Streptomyces griseorubiginosus]|uniref:lasso peptide biosynthesis PqqD family chaperone n=1 Tax=Streptomyces griseorubiginosus TaxID=67304 RepID=UPI001AD7A846|nr:lasso peptide biosynthesis PqqD family chaperone [Streptomyces griseorubiginosus]MBO4256232.1 lasso peptide biosynthesis PqqD family chaperone [Streptomyces griseorubiginosus]